MGLWDIDKIPYVGREKGPQEGLAFHYYDADKVVAGKKMKDWLRFGVAWWHTFDQELVDPFGTGTAQRPWYGKYSDPEDEALAKVDYAFEFFQKLGVEYFCFHDRDIAPEGDTLRETDKNLDKVVDKIEENMKSTGIKLLWNTSSLFTNPRFVSGASTSPFADIYAYAGGQLKHSLEIAKRLGAENYVFWGGREGYENLWNTQMKREQEHMAKFFHMCHDYAKEIGLDAQFLIEPKPKEPTLHQYDFDAATAIEFLRNVPEDKYDLMIVDPPAFAKHHKVLGNAMQGYKRLNARALAQIKSGGLLFTFSCSQAVSKELFRTTVFSAAAIAGRKVRILHQLTQPADHPINIYHPEGEYLKGLVLYVE
mgnify:CR=1 FL=1